MSNKDTQREIEELRVLADAMNSGQKKAKAVNQPSEEENINHNPTGDAQSSTVVVSGTITDRHAPPNSRQIMQWSVILAVTLAILVTGRDFLVPLAVAVLMWNLLNALAGVFGRIKIGSTSLPGWLVWTLALSSLLLVNTLIYWIVMSQSDALRAAAPVYQANFAKLTGKFTTLIGIEKMPNTSQLMESLNLGALLSWLGGSVGSIFSELILIAIYVAFLLAEQRHFPEKITRLASDEENAERLRNLMSSISKQIQTYVGIKTVVSLLTGFVSYVILRLVGVDFAAVWALIIFLLNYIPTVGSALGVIFPALLTLVQFEPLAPFIMVVIGLGTTQFVIGNVVEPAMMGSSLNLSSFVIILSLTFWGMIWGIAGMVLCVPITVIIAIICSHVKQLQWIAVLLSADGRLMKTS